MGVGEVNVRSAHSDKSLLHAGISKSFRMKRGSVRGPAKMSLERQAERIDYKEIWVILKDLEIMLLEMGVTEVF